MSSTSSTFGVGLEMNGVGEWFLFGRKARRRAGKASGKGEAPSGGKAPRRLPTEVVAKFNAQNGLMHPGVLQPQQKKVQQKAVAKGQLKEAKVKK